MQLYVSDYLADTAHLTAQQHGAYMLLLMNYWQRGKALDNSNERLSHVARLSPEEWADAKPILEEFFIVEGNLWSHARVEDDLAKIREKSAKASFAGKRSSVVRAMNERSTDVQQSFNHKDEDEDEEEDEEEDKNINKKEMFDNFWKIYPLKVGKGAAIKAFEKAIRTTDVEVIIKGAQRYLSDPNRVQAYTAHASTWLNAQRWLDEPLPQRAFSPDDKREKELREAKERAEREREATAEWFKQVEEQRQRAVPPPQELRDLMKKISTK
jgi:uncharacterized protein YdaU (DUF1376 family)